MQDTMTVTSNDGKPVRVRRHPATASETTARLAVGTTVRVGDETNGWRPIATADGSVTGYMMTRFLRSGTENPRPVTLSDEDYQRICDARDRMEDALRQLKRITGVS